jgi:hypothetical protein
VRYLWWAVLVAAYCESSCSRCVGFRSVGLLSFLYKGHLIQNCKRVLPIGSARKGVPSPSGESPPGGRRAEVGVLGRVHSGRGRPASVGREARAARRGSRVGSSRPSSGDTPRGTPSSSYGGLVGDAARLDRVSPGCSWRSGQLAVSVDQGYPRGIVRMSPRDAGGMAPAVPS